MRVADTVRIAEELGLPHGRYQGTPQVLTSDFLVDFDDQQRPTVAIQAKYSAELQKPEVIERIELGRRYWLEKGIPWAIILRNGRYQKQAVANIQWLYPAKSEDGISLDELEHSPTAVPDTNSSVILIGRLTTVAQGLDMTGELEPGQGGSQLASPITGQALFPVRHR